MTELNITRSEIDSGQMTEEHLDAGVKAILQEGYVVLNGVVDPEHLDILHERMLADLAALTARDDAPFNWNTGNIQQDPPPLTPYLFKDILVNDMVIALTSAILGTPVKSVFYSGNTAMPLSTSRQPVHADTGHLWPNLEVAHPPVQLVVNVPIVDVSPANGSTEIWPGTHLDTTVTAGKDIKLPADVLEARRAVSPPFQPTIARGGILIRDIRLWHAGMPNRTEAPRPMIAMIHVPQWLESGLPLTFPAGTEEFFEHPILRTCARFVDSEIDYINAPHGFEYVKPAAPAR